MHGTSETLHQNNARTVDTIQPASRTIDTSALATEKHDFGP